MNQIIDRLYIGDIQDAGRPPLLGAHDITAVVSLTHADPEDDYPSDVTVETVPLVDGPQNDVTDLKTAVETLVELYEATETVFVHCSAGASRSVTTVAVSLTRLTDRSLREAFEDIEETHPPAHPHPALVEQASSLV